VDWNSKYIVHYNILRFYNVIDSAKLLKSKSGNPLQQKPISPTSIFGGPILKTGFYFRYLYRRKQMSWLDRRKWDY